MVELFMRRKAALSASQLDLPPVHDSLRFFWSGMDLRKVIAEDLNYWPDRVGGGQLELREQPSHAAFDSYYSIYSNCLLWVFSRDYSQAVTPGTWVGGGASTITAGYTVELMVRCDWEICRGGIIVGSTGAGTSTLAFWGDTTNGLWCRMGGANVVYMGTGPVEGAHCYTVTCTYEQEGDIYHYRGYLDGDYVGEFSSARYYSGADRFYPKVALGALASHTRPLTEEEIGRNVRYYKSIWRD